WTGERDKLLRGGLAAEPFTEIDAAIFTERGNGLAGSGVERVDEVHDANEDAFIGAVAPIGETAGGLRAGDARIKFPEELSVGGVEGEDFLGGRDAVEQRANHERAGLESAGLAGVVGPGDLKIFDVFAIYLGERGVVGVRGVAA